ncbi:hypothetical protein KVT40_003568 [Elsinoe batatas]|uniref:Uncharacterized protein n=1 Tax=Elsinoe batatas TaxID=2601811 RepID=A0A8K0L2E9_9PEZI|nr:hypothetical protein KVT40_003568 [Elsinoe batatas]
MEAEQRSQDYGPLLNLGLSPQVLDAIEAQHNIWPTRVTSRVRFFNTMHRLLVEESDVNLKKEGVQAHHLEDALARFYHISLQKQERHIERMVGIMLSKEFFGTRRLITVETQCTALWELSELLTDRNRNRKKRAKT